MEDKTNEYMFGEMVQEGRICISGIVSGMGGHCTNWIGCTSAGSLQRNVLATLRGVSACLVGEWEPQEEFRKVRNKARRGGWKNSKKINKRQNNGKQQRTSMDQQWCHIIILAAFIR